MITQKHNSVLAGGLAVVLVGILVALLILVLTPVATGQGEELDSFDNKTCGGYQQPDCKKPKVETLPATSVTSTSAILHGNVTDIESSSLALVYFEWKEGDTESINEAPPKEERDLIVKGDADKSFSAQITGLTPGETYSFRAMAEGNEQSLIDPFGTGNWETFTTAPVPACTSPEVETNAATGIEVNTAMLNGALLDLGSPAMESVEVSFEWGTDNSYGNETTSQAMTSTGTFNYQLSGLDPETAYHFRAKAEGCDDDYVYGADMSFTTASAPPISPTPTPPTPPIDLIPPTVVTESAVDVSQETAILNGTLEAMGTADSVEVSFEWGTSDSYGYVAYPQTILMSEPGAFDAALDGLECETTYHFRAVGLGDGTGYGDDLTFTTSECAEPTPSDIPPIVETGTPVDITTDAATLVGVLEDMGSYSNVDVFFVWGTESHDDLHADQYENQTDSQTKSGTGAFANYIDELEPATWYYFRAKAVGGNYGDEHMFRTKCMDVIIVTTKSEAVTSNSAKMGGMLEDMGTEESVEVYFEWGTTTDYGNETVPQPLSSTGPFEAKAKGLECDTDYHFRAIAKGAGCIDFGYDRIFHTEECADGGLNPWVAIGPILAAILLALLIFLLLRRRKGNEEAANA